MLIFRTVNVDNVSFGFFTQDLTYIILSAHKQRVDLYTDRPFSGIVQFLNDDPSLLSALPMLAS